jgi:hypothetical protein
MLCRVCPRCCRTLKAGAVACLVCFGAHLDMPPEDAPPLQVRFEAAAISTAAQKPGMPIVQWRVPSS